VSEPRKVPSPSTPKGEGENQSLRSAFVVGLIGGIGAGKSLVAQAFAKHGAVVISGDALGHEALRNPAVLAQVVERFGPGVLHADGTVSRRRLAQIVFADPAERRALEALVFPYIEARFREELVKARAAPGDGPVLVVLDAAVMLEAGWNSVSDRLVYVHAPRAQRLARLAARGWGPAEVAARERAQLPLAVKAGRADAAVDNSGPPEAVERQVAALLAGWGFPAPAGGACV
jgi:dephospho-CoA kinase